MSHRNLELSEATLRLGVEQANRVYVVELNNE